MTGDNVPFSEARADQARRLGEAIRAVTGTAADLAAAGGLSGPGPIFVGIGASHAAACAPVWTLRARGIHSWRLAAGDYPLPFPRSDHPVIGVSQSGRSAETLAVLESVEQGQRYAVVNRTPSPIADTAKIIIDIGNIPDSYASTVGYTATVAALGILADSWDGGAIDPGWQDMAAVVRETEQLLTESVRQLAVAFTRARSADFVGAGPSVGSAEAAALLFREVARVPSTGMGTRQYLHGSMESAGDSVHVLFGDTRETEVATTLAAAGHQVILVTSQDVAHRRNLEIVRLPARPPAQRVILEALAMQILVAEVAQQRAIEIEEFIFHNSDTKVPAGERTRMKVLAGLDVGGTKLAVRVETIDGDEVVNAECGAAEWTAVPAAAAAFWLAGQLRRHLMPGSEIVALGVGAQGCNSQEIAADLRRALESLGLRATVVNDGALLVPAAGLEHGIGIVAGTGSIGIAEDAGGNPLRAGGWGWVLGDEGGAAAIVREATRAALAAHDAGRADDGLLTALRRAFEVPDAERLARAVNDDPTADNWAPHAPAVFAAADHGSALADAVITAAAGQLTTLVGTLIARGAVGCDVVAAGGVIVNQPRLARAFRDHLARRHPSLRLRILSDQPVAGAVTLARRLLTPARPSASQP